VVELLFSTIPQLVIVSTNSNKPQIGWSGLAVFTLLVMIAMFLKNLAIVTIYTVRRYVDNREDPPMRPRTGVNLSKVELEAFVHMQSYLIDPHDDGCDADGNTSIHQLMKLEPDWAAFEHQMSDYPHQLFMLNKMGQTPLDCTIEMSILAEQQEMGFRKKQNESQAEEADAREKKAH
jgi:hypothetical protein